MRTPLWITLLLLCLFSPLSWAKQGFHLSSYMGLSKSIDHLLSIHLEDQADQVFRAQWDNKSFTDSHWWAGRLDYWKGNKLYGVELIHHKIYLKNINPTIQNFSISDGYNLVYFNVGRQLGPHIIRVGAGIIFAHPDISITGRERYLTKGLKGHKLAGPTVQADYERWIWENSFHYISLDAKFTLSYAITPISNNLNEYAIIPDIAFHFSLGVGSKPHAFNQSFPKKLLYFVPAIYPRLVGEYILGTGMFPDSYEL